MKKICCFLMLILLFNSFTVYAENAPHPRIALTFDDGPHPVYTAKILKILEKYGIRATFFVIGCNAELNPELIKAEAEAGHEIGNHTYYHNSCKKLSGVQIMKEIGKTDELLYKITGSVPTAFRPPEGSIDSELTAALTLSGKSVVLWNTDTRDWAHVKVKTVVNNVLNNAKDGSIVLFHDYITGYSPTCEALELIIPELLSRGFSFVTVSEMLDKDRQTYLTKRPYCPAWS